MIKLLTAAAIIIFSINSTAQVDFRLSMGVQFQSTPSVTDYINQNFAPSSNQLGSFSSAGIFSGEAGFPVFPTTRIGVEVAYLFNSYTYNYDLGQFNLNYDIIMPSVLYYYTYYGKGYYFKFGGGAGVRFVMAQQKLPASTPVDYTSTGVGFILRADGNTSLGGNFYANIGGDIRYDLNGTPKHNGEGILNHAYNENVNLNSFSVGVRLGITYKFQE